MKQISSRTTVFYKRVFPILWFGVITIVFGTSAIAGATAKNVPAPLFIAPVFMAIVGFFVMKNLVWDLVDEVYDCGDSLLIRNRGREESVALSNIMNVSASTLTNPPRILLRLASPCSFGGEIVFSPIKQFTLNPFAKDPISEDLIVRVDQARSKRSSRL